jgi:acyl carrier protein
METRKNLTNETAIHDSIRAILADYCDLSSNVPLNLSLSIRNDLAIDSLTFVSILLRLEDVLETDLLESGIELHRIETIGDLVRIGRTVQDSKSSHLATEISHKESA